ncbi:MAG TPA: hypothetical protein VFT84_03360, partial [Gemmatimonadales bacterium]|nr:hypothetical protein [Gemmatimonadales bacterium]
PAGAAGHPGGSRAHAPERMMTGLGRMSASRWRLRLAAPGLLLGVVSARVLGGFLYGVRPADPLTLGLVPTVVAFLVAAAALVPARRAARTEPMDVLRSE